MYVNILDIILNRRDRQSLTMSKDDMVYLRESVQDVLEIIDILHKRIGDLTEEIKQLKTKIDGIKQVSQDDSDDSQSNMYQ
jgi:hypothetical protein